MLALFHAFMRIPVWPPFAITLALAASTLLPSAGGVMGSSVEQQAGCPTAAEQVQPPSAEPGP